MRLTELGKAAAITLSLSAAAGCSVQPRLNQHYAGTLKSSVPACPSTDATLVVQDGKVVFAPADSTWLLTGKFANGNIEASATRSSFDHKTYATTLRAVVTETTIQGTYVSPLCTYDVNLARY